MTSILRGQDISQPVVKFTDVSFSYPGGQAVFHELNVEVYKRDLILIKGESGSGKSTFLKLFNRFCDPSKGRVLYNNRDLREYAIERIRSSVIYLPQLPVIIEGTVENNLSFPFSFHSHKQKIFDREKAGEWMDYFRVNVLLKQDASKLSTGQKQRIALIRSILLEPELLLLDEPGSALDSSNKRLIEERIAHIIESSSVTVLMATHSDAAFSGTDFRLFRLEDRKMTFEQ